MSWSENVSSQPTPNRQVRRNGIPVRSPVELTARREVVNELERHCRATFNNEIPLTFYRDEAWEDGNDTSFPSFSWKRPERL